MKNLYYEVLRESELDMRSKAIIAEINESLHDAFNVQHSKVKDVLNLIDEYNRNIRETENVPF